MPDKYYLVESGALEKLLRTHFMLTQSTLLFEHLLSHSDRPMFLSARKVCEVLGLDRHQLEQCRKKRMIRARAVNGQMMYDAYELLALTELFTAGSCGRPSPGYRSSRCADRKGLTASAAVSFCFETARIIIKNPFVNAVCGAR